MSADGASMQHGKPPAMAARARQPYDREGQAGSRGGDGEARSTVEAR
jgi:hypothetical protein